MDFNIKYKFKKTFGKNPLKKRKAPGKLGKKRKEGRIPPQRGGSPKKRSFSLFPTPPKGGLSLKGKANQQKEGSPLWGGDGKKEGREKRSFSLFPLYPSLPSFSSFFTFFSLFPTPQKGDFLSREKLCFSLFPPLKGNGDHLSKRLEKKLFF